VARAVAGPDGGAGYLLGDSLGALLRSAVVTCYDFLMAFDASNVADLLVAAGGVLAVAWGFRVVKRALFNQ
jgi:hypothetical protein